MAWEYFIAGVDTDGEGLAAIFSIDLEDGEIISDHGARHMNTLKGG